VPELNCVLLDMVLCVLKFSNNLDSHDNKPIGLYNEGIVRSLPGFGIIMTADFFDFFWEVPKFCDPDK